MGNDLESYVECCKYKTYQNKQLGFISDKSYNLYSITLASFLLFPFVLLTSSPLIHFFPYQ